MCVQRFDDSQCSAIHTTFRALLRSSSMREPRDPLLKVLTFKLSRQKGHPGCIKATPKGAEARLVFHGGLRVERPMLAISSMIPPQVHLRRPCYDFYFL